MGRVDMTESHTTEQDSLHIDMNTLSNVKDFGLTYHEREDTLFIRPDKPRAAVSFDWNGDFWLRVDPETGEIVGIEVNDFEGVFLKKHPELAKAWKGIKPSSRRLCRVPRSVITDDIHSEPFNRILSNFLISFFKRNPCQVSFLY